LEASALIPPSPIEVLVERRSLIMLKLRFTSKGPRQAAVARVTGRASTVAAGAGAGVGEEKKPILVACSRGARDDYLDKGRVFFFRDEEKKSGK